MIRRVCGLPLVDRRAPSNPPHLPPVGAGRVAVQDLRRMWSRRVAAVGCESLAVRRWSRVVLHPPRDPALADTTPETA